MKRRACAKLRRPSAPILKLATIPTNRSRGGKQHAPGNFSQRQSTSTAGGQSRIIALSTSAAIINACWLIFLYSLVITRAAREATSAPCREASISCVRQSLRHCHRPDEVICALGEMPMPWALQPRVVPPRAKERRARATHRGAQYARRRRGGHVRGKRRRNRRPVGGAHRSYMPVAAHARNRLLVPLSRCKMPTIL